jgi:hypothetical protein
VLRPEAEPPCCVTKIIPPAKYVLPNLAIPDNQHETAQIALFQADLFPEPPVCRGASRRQFGALIFPRRASSRAPDVQSESARPIKISCI